MGQFFILGPALVESALATLASGGDLSVITLAPLHPSSQLWRRYWSLLAFFRTISTIILHWLQWSDDRMDDTFYHTSVSFITCQAGCTCFCYDIHKNQLKLHEMTEWIPAFGQRDAKFWGKRKVRKFREKVFIATVRSLQAAWNGVIIGSFSSLVIQTKTFWIHRK